MTKRNGDEQGRLIGWLVSYSDDELGGSHEIRAGRTIIGGEELDGERVITVTDASVSNPHSAFRASTKHRILVQDIFSENGTYLQRNGAGEEEKITSPIELRHGDWIRFGKADRYQLCLIDAPKR